MVAAQILAAVGLVHVAAAHAAELDVGFCDSNGHGFSYDQPSNQMERWRLPYDNGTHLVIDWHNDRRVSGRNVSEYYVNVQTSVPILNIFVSQFGGFPQDVCAPGGSKARNAVQGPATATPCNPYGPSDHYKMQTTSFEIPTALRKMATWDITVTVRAYGSHAPAGRPSERTPVTWWCHKYQRKVAMGGAPPAPTVESGAATPWRRLSGWLRGVWNKLSRKRA